MILEGFWRFRKNLHTIFFQVCWLPLRLGCRTCARRCAETWAPYERRLRSVAYPELPQRGKSTASARIRSYDREWHDTGRARL